MWEWKHQNGEVRQFRVTPSDKRCPICGQYFKSHEKGIAIVPPMDIRKLYKKLSQNLTVHHQCWVDFCDNTTDDVKLAEKFQKHKRPAQNIFDADEIARINAFRMACLKQGFCEVFEKPYGLKCKQRGSSVYIEYNVYSDSIDLDYRGKRGLFDGFYSRQIIANIYNAMHATLGDGKKDDYSATKTINSIIQETEKMVNGIL